MDIFEEYAENIGKDYEEVDVIGRKLRVRVETGGIYVHDLPGILDGYDREYVLLCMIRNNVIESYDGRLTKLGGRLYFVDTNDPDPSVFHYPDVSKGNWTGTWTIPNGSWDSWTIVGGPTRNGNVYTSGYLQVDTPNVDVATTTYTTTNAPWVMLDANSVVCASTPSR